MAITPLLPMTRTETSHGAIFENAPPHLLSDHATRFMISNLDLKNEMVVAEAGCGSGVLCIFAAKCGASKVYGTDIDEDALSCARENAKLNGAANIEFINGSLLEPVPGDLDAVIALLPHKPAPRAFSVRYYGGSDGSDLLLAVIRQSAEKLKLGGRLYLYLNSIANPAKVLDEFSRDFSVSMLAEKKRYFTVEEFDSLTPGMFDYLLAQKSKGEAEFHEDAQGLFFWARIYSGVTCLSGKRKSK